MIVTLKDGSQREYPDGITAIKIGEDLGSDILKNALSVKIDSKVCELNTPITKDCKIEFLTFDTEEGKKTFWHTSSHVMAQAVKRLYPQTLLAIGPAIDNGFYYDFDSDIVFSQEVIDKVEAEMKKIVKEQYKLERFELPRDKAIEFMKDEPYKVELIEDLPEGEALSFYREGEFTDLCAGPHLTNTSKIKAFKLMPATGAYWRGSEKNKMLQRVYGISFPTATELDEYLARMEEAKKRDHRKIGKDLDLFAIFDEGPGFPFFMPNGMIIRNELEDFWRQEHKKMGISGDQDPDHTERRSLAPLRTLGSL